MFKGGNKNHFLGAVFLSIFFIVIGCNGKSIDFTELEKHTEYVEGKGYCVVKYDKRGCNNCLLIYLSERWSWMCTLHCSEEDQEKANQCIGYKSKEDIVKEHQRDSFK